MKYSEVINFNPIETVIQIKDANDEEKAKNLVKSYVMSDEMADKFNSGIIEALQFDEVIDNKGVLIVGNYGTGKSHLMSLISSIANKANNVNYLGNKKFAEYSKRVAGKFEVLRIEIGAVSNSLRNIVALELEKDLGKRGINFKFPSADEITNNKTAFEEMMYKFENKYPDKGYLLVIDELLDYLRSRKGYDLISDLNFLREIGEFVKDSRLRLICGIQEQLFDNPAFTFVSQALSRVKDRYEQIIIRKEDTTYVVTERILGKTAEQKAIVREHLMPFCHLYSGMSERIDDYVQLYPIHPSYIEIFNNVYIAEKREVLKTISITVRKLLDQEIPEKAPGIVSFDSYWPFIKDNYARKAEYEVREVMEKSAVLEEKVIKTFPQSKQIYKNMALQIINALSVHRLTTSGIEVKIGLTAENLKDDLCLFMENMPEQNADFLLATVVTSIKEVITLVSGQFIEHNRDNGQYFLDLKKDIDYDAKIEQKVKTMDLDYFNRYFNSLIYGALEWDAAQYVTNFDIYEYFLNWESRNVYREGYLFMGLSTERSTAQPPRDFYIYILPPYMEEKDKSKIRSSKSDEVFFEFQGNEAFYENLKLYAAASEMRLSAAEQNTKNIYGQKAESYRKKLQNWLNDNKNTCFFVIFKENKKTLIETTKGKSRLTIDFKSSIDLAASMALEETFENKYPDFPKLKIKITRENRAVMLERIIRSFAGKPTKDILDYLDSFNLIKEGQINVSDSKYARYIINLMENLPRQGVLNRTDIIEEINDTVFIKEFKIDIGYFAPVFLALVYTGDITITLRNNSVLNASNIEEAAKLGNQDMAEFKILSKPKEAALKEINKLVEIMRLPPGLAVSPKLLEKSLDRILEETFRWAIRANESKRNINENFFLWGEPMIPQHFLDKYESQIRYVHSEFGGFKNKYNTLAKFNNLNLTLKDLEKIHEGIKTIETIEAYKELKNQCGSLINYISNIETLDLPTKIIKEISEAKNYFRAERDGLKEGENLENIIIEITGRLEKVKKAYIDFYIEQHQRLRLNHKSTLKLTHIKKSKKLSSLRKLKEIETVYSPGRLNTFEKTLMDFKTCYELELKELEESHICSHCKLRDFPQTLDVNYKIEALEDELDDIFSQWEEILIQYVMDTAVLENMALLGKEEQKIITDFKTKKKLPETVEDNFVNSFNLLFSELDKVTIQVGDLTKELFKIGPTTVQGLKEKIFEFIDAKVKDMDQDKLRIILKEDDSLYDEMTEEAYNG